MTFVALLLTRYSQLVLVDPHQIVSAATAHKKGIDLGVLIFKGMRVGFLEGDLRIGFSEDGTIESKAILSTSFNVVPLWLRVAHDNLALARTAFQNIAAQWDDDPENQKTLLIAELAPATQTIVACAIAYDALYAQLKPLAKVDNEEMAAWKKNKTSRAARISEVLRRVFRLNGEDYKQIKKVVTETIKLRDLAVHPSHELKNALNRPDVPVGLDWRFCVYRYENAATCYNNSVKLFTFFRGNASRDKAASENIESIFEALVEMNLISDDLHSERKSL